MALPNPELLFWNHAKKCESITKKAKARYETLNILVIEIQHRKRKMIAMKFQRKQLFKQSSGKSVLKRSR